MLWRSLEEENAHSIKRLCIRGRALDKSAHPIRQTDAIAIESKSERKRREGGEGLRYYY